MYPLLLKPAIKDYLWGGSKLITDFGFEAESDIAAEAWMLSCHKDGMNIVLNGEQKGKTISEVLEIWGKSALGKRAEKFPYFSLLVKLIDAGQKLSVQVHPDDKYALAVEGEYGKTEMWYVVDCEAGAELIYGFKENISKAEFETRIKENTLTEVCNSIPVHKGDVFFIEAGTLHAIGEGILIAEVQQNSNTTYRVSDYGRLGADGKPRELHVEKALEVTKLEKSPASYGQVGEVTDCGKNSFRELARCDLFTSGILSLRDSFTIDANDSFVSLVLLEGNAAVRWDGGMIEARKGNSIFVPSGLRIELKGEACILCSSI